MKLIIKPQGSDRIDLSLTKDTITIGRSSRCDIRLIDSKISRIHCVVERKDRKVVIRDLNSKNGIKINGRLQRECELQNGDIVLIGHAICCYQNAS